jgi:hypothetical protein
VGLWKRVMTSRVLCWGGEIRIEVQLRRMAYESEHFDVRELKTVGFVYFLCAWW